MEKDEARLNYFKELRESGLTKLFEEDVRIFFGGIVSSTRNPMNKEKLLEIFKQMPEAILPIQLEEHIVGLIKDTDVFRYHQIPVHDIMVHYIYINNDDLVGRNPDYLNPAGLSTSCTIGGDGSEKKSSDFSEFAMILIGDKHPVVTDRTRGFIVKHEFAHVILHYICYVVNPGIRAKYLEWLTEEELHEFDEFICDFVQFDSTIINKYTPNPIARFVDTMPLIYNDNAIEHYNPFIKAISPFFNELIGSTE